MIRLENITTDCFEYVSFEIRPGTLCKIITNSKYEKKVLFDTILGLQKPSGGRVFMFGKNIYSISEQESFKIFRRIGVIWLNGGLISNLKIWENIALPAWYHYGKRPGDIEERVLSLFRALGMDTGSLAEYTGKLPGHLPVHEKRLIGLIRAMIMEPELMIYDSIFEELNPNLVDSLTGLIREFHSGRPGRISFYISSDEQSLSHIKADITLKQVKKEFKQWQ